jgi:hypothetical protein
LEGRFESKPALSSPPQMQSQDVANGGVTFAAGQEEQSGRKDVARVVVGVYQFSQCVVVVEDVVRCDVGASGGIVVAGVDDLLHHLLLHAARPLHALHLAALVGVANVA